MTFHTTLEQVEIAMEREFVKNQRAQKRIPLRKYAALKKATKLAKKNEQVKVHDLVRMVKTHRVSKKQGGSKNIALEFM